MERKFSTNIKGKVRNFTLPKDKPLVPLYEAIVNSINAIDEMKQIDNGYEGKIEIEVLRERTIFSENDLDTVRGFRIIDNGIGFNDANMSSFMEADTEYKIKIGGKGVGRFSWLKAFSSVIVESVYKDNNVYKTRNFEFSLATSKINDINEVSTKNETGTCVILNNYIDDYKKNVPKELSALASKIIYHCFAYFLRSDLPRIIIFDNEKNIKLNDLFNEKINIDNNNLSFSIGEHEFNLLNIKVTDEKFEKKNMLLLCANERLVQSCNLEKLIINLDSSIYKNAGYWYVGVLTSKYFDENVDMNRLSFTLPNEDYNGIINLPSLKTIEKEACKNIQEVLKEYLDKVGKEKLERILHYVINIAPQYRHLHNYVPQSIEALKPGLTDRELDDALYGIKRDFENATKQECKDLLNKLDSGAISPEDYQNKFKETIGKISDVNKAALAEYVTHRRVILDLFNKGLNIKEDGKFNVEKYMHQLIYPMGSTSDEMPYERHNLWLIDEKLSFCRYISSDKPFNNSRNEKRTDIMILDSPVVVADGNNNGEAFNSIIIFELKKPMRNDYTSDDNPVNQLYTYVRRIREGAVKDSNQRDINVTANTQFYLYAICDITPTLKTILDTMSFTRTPDNLGAYQYNNNYKAYIEILSYDKVKNDSQKRNRVLFEKLGIS